MRTKMQISAETLKEWAEHATASRDAAKLLTKKALELSYDASYSGRDVEPTASTIRTLLRAAGFVGVQHSVFVDLIENEARIALKVGESR